MERCEDKQPCLRCGYYSCMTEEPPAITLKPLFMHTCFFLPPSLCPVILSYCRRADILSHLSLTKPLYCWQPSRPSGAVGSQVRSSYWHSQLTFPQTDLESKPATFPRPEAASTPKRVTPKRLSCVKYTLHDLHNPPELSLLRNCWSCNNASAFLPVHGLVYARPSNTEHIISVLNPTSFLYVASGFAVSTFPLFLCSRLAQSGHFCKACQEIPLFSWTLTN